MSAGMAGIIAAHALHSTGETKHARHWMCQCGQFKSVLGYEAEMPEPHAAHVAEELTNAGFGKLDPLAAAMADPEGRALVQAIHDRKAGQ